MAHILEFYISLFLRQNSLLVINICMGKYIVSWSWSEKQIRNLSGLIEQIHFSQGYVLLLFGDFPGQQVSIKNVFLF